MRILFLDSAHPFLINSLRGDGYECDENYSGNYNEVKNSIHEYDGIIIRSRFILDKFLLERATNLKFIARAGAGMESIDTEFAAENNIACLNSPEGNRDAVGEHALGMLLSLMNNLNRADREVRSGKWIRENNRGHELNGTTVGIIGYGNMGSSFAKKLQGFECNVLAYDKYKSGFGNNYVKESAIDEILQHSDILSLHIPLTTETEYLINAGFINQFTKPFYLINSARGKCVSTKDLVSALESGKIKGACLDVIEFEDLSFEKFKIENIAADPSWNYLINSEKVILSPHIAGWTFESHIKIAETLYRKICALTNKK